jgi:hypothetical protein
MIIAYVDPNMPTLLRQCKRKALNGWTADVSIHIVREVVLALMHEWEQAVEDTATAPGLQRIDAMSQKMWLEALQDVWPSWVAALYLTDQHQFGNTVEELFHFLQTREPEQSPNRPCAVAAMAIQEFGQMTVEEALHMVHNQQLAHLLTLSRQISCWRCRQNHYLSECRAKRSEQEIAGLSRPWPPMPPHESQATLHQLALPITPIVAPDVQGMVSVLAALEGIRQDIETHQMSIQDQSGNQNQMAQALLTICTQLNTGK